MEIHHCTGLIEARSIILAGEIWANDHEPGSAVHAGPFFFVKGHEANEVATNPLHREIKLIFECWLPVIEVLRDSKHSTNLLSGSVSHLSGKLIVERNPYRAEQIMQARIKPPCSAALKLIEYEASVSMSGSERELFDEAKRTLRTISIASWPR